MFKNSFVGRLGLFLGISALTSACAVGEIGDSPGAPGLDLGFNDAALTCPGVNPDVSASDGWQSKQASQPAPDSLYFEVMARPTEANLDALVAVGAQDIHDFSDAAITVRFSDTGVVDVMDDSDYSSDGSFEYDPGVWYNIAISADVTARTYDVEVGRCGEKRRSVIRGARFRAASNVYDRLSTWGVWSSRLASLQLSTPTWMASGTCAPATCEALGSECGQRSDGCNGTLNCGVCGGGQSCSSGACVDEPVSVPPPPSCTPASCRSLGAGCGAPSDGCDGTLNCGICGAGQLCSNNVCVDQPVTPPPPPPACVPTSCQALGAECGTRSSGCGGTLNCGGCGAGQLCSSSLCVDEPVTLPPPPACVPTSCQALGAECGARSNGCGGTLNCGGCGTGDICSSGVCVAEPVTPPACVPDTCQSTGTECGLTSNGCGGSLNCGGCSTGDMCSSGVCIAQPVTPPPPGSDPDRPWAHNTGPSNPGALSPSGSRTITTDGTVLENIDVTGDLWIDADNVTIRNFRINASGISYGINVLDGHSGVVLEDGEIYGMSSAGILGLGYTGRRLHIHDSSGDAIKAQGSGGGPTVIEYSYIEKLGTSAEAHADGNQTRGGSNITFRYNNIFLPSPGKPDYPGAPYKSNSAFMLQLSISNMVIENNWLNGGNYTIYCQSGGIFVRNNIFGRSYLYGVRDGNCAEWSGNTWEDTGGSL